MEGIPFFMLAAPLCRQRAGRQCGNAVVDGDERSDGVEDNRDPDDDRREQQRQRRLVAAEIGLDDEKHKAKGVPDGHGFAEVAREEAQGFCLRVLIELPDHGIDKEGDGQFVADHKTGAEYGDDVE